MTEWLRSDQKDKELLERVQHRFTRMTEGFFVFAIYRETLEVRFVDA